MGFRPMGFQCVGFLEQGSIRVFGFRLGQGVEFRAWGLGVGCWPSTKKRLSHAEHTLNDRCYRTAP